MNAEVKGPSAKLAYFVPLFPQQNHVCFWRDMENLAEKGITLIPISSSRPKKTCCTHEWASQARQETFYADPPWPYLKDFMLALGKVRWGGLWQSLKWVITHGRHSLRFRGNLLLKLFSSLFLGAFLIRQRVQHLHLQVEPTLDVMAIFIHAIYGLSYSASFHKIPDTSFKRDHEWNHASFIICISQRIKFELSRASLSLSCPLLVSPMGVDHLYFTRLQPYTPFTDPKKILKLFCCAQLDPSKGYPELLHCVSRLIDHDWDVQLRIAGQDNKEGGGYKVQLMRLARELSIERYVSFLGSINQNELKVELEKAHIFILLTKSDSSAIAYMEAMAMELPVLGSRLGGVPELITDRISGILVEPKNIASIVKALELLLKEPGQCKRMGHAARKIVRESFSHHRSTEAIIKGLREYTNFFDSDPLTNHAAPKSQDG